MKNKFTKKKHFAIQSKVTTSSKTVLNIMKHLVTIFLSRKIGFPS